MAEIRTRVESARPGEASHDPLTGLLDRIGFVTVVESVRGSLSGALLLAGIDELGQVNDDHGHAIGDAALRIAGQRLTRVIRPDDVVGRLGGDEFVVFLPGADVYVATIVGSRMLEVLDDPIEVDGVCVRLGVSIGVDTSASASLADQLAAATTALARARARGRGRVEVASA